MNEFDEYVAFVMEGLESMGTGGLAQQAKGATPQQNGTQNGAPNAPVKNGVQMKFSGGPQQANNGQNGQQFTQDELTQFDGLNQLQKGNAQQFNQQVQQLAKTNPDLLSKYISTLQQPQQQTGGQNVQQQPQQNIQ